jgi:hypothetical protein
MDSAEPNLISDNGILYLTWLETVADGMSSLMFAQGRPEGAAVAWSEPRSIARSADMFVNWADFPSLVVLPGGRMAAHWLVRNGTQSYAYDVWLAISSDGGRTWSEPVRPHRDGTSAEHGFVSLLPTEDGLDVFWLDGRNMAGEGPGATQLMHTRWTPEGFGPESVLDERVCDCCQTSAVSTPEGPVVVYRDRTLDEVRDIGIVRVAGDTWTRPLPVRSDRWRIAACPVNGPAAAARGDDLWVAWYTRAADDPSVMVVRSSDAGETISPAVRIDDGGAVGRVDIAWIDDELAVVSWIADRGSYAEIVMQPIDVAGPTGPPWIIARTVAGRDSGFPRIAVIDDDVYVASTHTIDGAKTVRVHRVTALSGV